MQDDDPLNDEPRCACGARMARTAKRCPKCRAWNRWLRRQTGRQKADERRSTRRPGGKRRPGNRAEVRAVAA